jgi:hypothetical protein
MDSKWEMPKLNVLLREPNHRDRANIKSRLIAIFKYAGFDCDLREAVNYKEISEKIMEERCDILVTDLTLGEPGFPGLTDLSDLKRDYPYLFAIIISSGSVDVSITENQKNRYDLFFTKRTVLNGDDNDLREIAKKIANKYSLLPNIIVRGAVNVPSVFTEEDELTQADVRIIARQCLWTSNNYDIPIAPDELNLRQMTGGFSGSRVFEVNVRCREENTRYVPLILKISEISRALQEKNNYHQFVKWLLPAPHRVEVLGFGSTAKWGGILYSYAFGGNKKVSNLTEPIREGNVKVVRAYLGRVFGAQSRGFFRLGSKERANSISARYSKRYFDREEKVRACLESFERSAAENFKITRKGHTFSGNTTKIKDPVRVLFNDFTESAYQSAVIHGDLNSNNIITYGNDIVFIDFQDVGRGHAFEDFVAIESSIRLFFGNKRDGRISPAKLLAAERKLWTGRAPSGGEYQLIMNVRKNAMAHAPDALEWEYAYAVAAIHFRLHRLRGIENKYLAPLTAAVIASIERLEAFGAKARTF